MFNKNNKSGNIILKIFLIEFEYIINCHENCYLSFPTRRWQQILPTHSSKNRLEQKHRYNKITLQKERYLIQIYVYTSIEMKK